MRGVGASTVSLHPEEALARIRAGAEEACRGDFGACALELASRFRLVVRYKDASRAYAMSFYPGAELKDDVTLTIEVDDYFEVLRALRFVV